MPFYDENENEFDKAPVTTEVVLTPVVSAKYDTEPKEGLDIELEGSPWVCQYYSQLLDSNDTPRRLDLGLSPTLQQYVLINDFVILVRDELSSTQDDFNITTVSGAGTLYPALSPNIGDHFVAQMSDRQYGLFVITSTERNKFYSYTSWNIAYQLVDYINPTYQDNLDVKTVNERWFDHDKPSELGRSKIQQVAKYETASKIIELLEIYWDEFYDLSTQSLVLGTETKIYDDAVVEFLAKILPHELRSILPEVKDYSVPSVTHRKAISTLWDILLSGKDTHLSRVDRYISHGTLADFRSNYVFSAIGFSKYDTVLIPSKTKALTGYAITPDTETYIFTDSFYEKNAELMTSLESLVIKALERTSYTAADVIVEADKALELTSNEKFYTIPIMVWLLLKLL